MPINNILPFDQLKRKKQMESAYNPGLPQPLNQQQNMGYSSQEALAPRMATPDTQTIKPATPSSSGAIGSSPVAQSPTTMAQPAGLAKSSGFGSSSTLDTLKTKLQDTFQAPLNIIQDQYKSSLPPAVETIKPEAEAQTLATAPASFETISSEIGPADPITTGTDTQAGSVLYDQVMNAANGNSSEVMAARDRLDRNKTLTLEQAQRQAHEQAIRAGYRPGTIQYQEMLRKGVGDARNANIEAENKYNEFARETRRKVWDELAGLDDRDWGRMLENKEDRQKISDDIYNLLPSDEAKLIWKQAESNGLDMMGILGKLKDPETGEWNVTDPTYLEKARNALEESANSMTFDTELARKEWLETTWNQMQNNIFNPISTEGERREEEDKIDARIDSFVSDGDTTGMVNSDWQSLVNDSNKLSKAITNGQVFDWGSSEAKLPQTSAWKENEKMSTSVAKKYVSEAMPDVQKGTIVHKEGAIYEVTNPVYVQSDTEWGDTKNKIRVMAINLATGKEEAIWTSNRFRP